ncbi:MAG: DUF2029 domain-containing protein, partial [Planctomycetes bacterium]|nr:DUF2029 domain-containing protein [Planctomycetota bacterium]
KEWMALGRIEPLTHNVYSYLPGYVEAAYYHLAVLVGDPIQAVYACQLLHASMAVLTAVVVARLAGRMVDRSVARPVGAVTAVLLIGTPWVVVVGSLGYNEMAVTLLLAVALYILLARSPTTWQHGVILGLLTAAACGAKLTAAGFVVAPLMIVALFTIARRRWLGVILAAGVAGLFGLLPYLLRNWMYSGNPVFPFMTGMFGSAHWSQDQVGIWIAGHVSGVRPSVHRTVEPTVAIWTRPQPQPVGAVVPAVVDSALADRGQPHVLSRHSQRSAGHVEARGATHSASPVLACTYPPQIAVPTGRRRRGHPQHRPGPWSDPARPPIADRGQTRPRPARGFAPGVVMRPRHHLRRRAQRRTGGERRTSLASYRRESLRARANRIGPSRLSRHLPQLLAP